MLAYIRLIVNPKDDEAFLRIVNYPARGIGDVTQSRLRTLATERGMSIWEALASLTPDSPEWKVLGGKVREFVALITEIALGRTEKSLYEFGLMVATRSGILNSLTMAGPEGADAKANVEELLNSMQEFSKEKSQLPAEEGEPAEPTIEEWLQNVALLTDMDKEGDGAARVTLMTVHASKGLEFDTVFIVGLEEQLFPSLRSMGDEAQLEEERRLFYVALTRAERQATLSFAQTRYKWGNTEFCRPSRFLKELDQQYLDLRFDPDEENEDSPLERLRRQYGANNRSSESGYGGRRFGGTGGASDSRYGGYQPKQESARSAQPRPIEPPRPASLRKITPTATPATPTTPATSSGAPKVGDRVGHPKFGQGSVVEVEPLANDIKVTVNFDNPAAGKKTLLNKFAKLQVIG